MWDNELFFFWCIYSFTAVCLLCSIDFLWSDGYFVIIIYLFRWYYVLNENLHCFSLVAFSFILKTSIFIVRFSRKHVNKLWILGLNIVTKFSSKSYTFYNSSSTYKPCPAGHDRAGQGEKKMNISFSGQGCAGQGRAQGRAGLKKMTYDGLWYGCRFVSINRFR